MTGKQRELARLEAQVSELKKEINRDTLNIIDQLYRSVGLPVRIELLDCIHIVTDKEFGTLELDQLLSGYFRISDIVQAVQDERIVFVEKGM